jgi:hypothetical protein
LGEGSAPLQLGVSQRKKHAESFAEPEIRPLYRKANREIMERIAARKLKHKANCQLLAAFSHTTATYERILFQTHSLTLAVLDPFRAAASGSDTKAHRTTELQAFSGKPGLPTWQRPAGAAPCRTALTISED